MKNENRSEIQLTRECVKYNHAAFLMIKRQSDFMKVNHRRRYIRLT